MWVNNCFFVTFAKHLRKKINILVSSINQEFLENPKSIPFDCDSIYPIGVTIQRQYDDEYCIVAKRVFTFKQGQMIFGTTSFKSIQEFTNFRNNNCIPCSNVVDNCCYLTFNGCYVTFNNKKITHDTTL